MFRLDLALLKANSITKETCILMSIHIQMYSINKFWKSQSGISYGVSILRLQLYGLKLQMLNLVVAVLHTHTHTHTHIHTHIDYIYIKHLYFN
jgi:hypothetical protein